MEIRETNTGEVFEEDGEVGGVRRKGEKMGVMELKLQNIIVNELLESDYQRLC